MAAEEVRKDKEVVLAAVKKDGSALEHAAEELKSDENFILEAVKIDGTALKWAADTIRGDKTFLLKAVKATKASWLMNFCTEELQKDEELKGQLATMAGEGLIFTYYSSSCLNDMRDAFVVSGVSVPGGPAQGPVMKELKSSSQGVLAIASVRLAKWVKCPDL